MTHDAQPDPTAALEAELAALKADNARLRQLLDARNVPGELRHRQRNTFAMLRMLIRSSAEPAEDLETYVSHLEDRLDAVARVQAAIDIFGQVDLADLIGSELLAYTVHEGGQATLTGPAVRLRPAAAQTFVLAVHELTINAIEHGCLGQPSGSLEIRWSVEPEASGLPLTLVWKEAGCAGIAEPGRSGFGTEVLTETIRYELKAATTLAYEPDGLRCTIRFPLAERVGRVLEDLGPA